MALKEKKSFFDLFPTPEYLSLSSGGLAITDEGVRFVRFTRGLFHSSLRLTTREKVEMPAGAVQSGYINDADKLKAVLKELAHKHDIKFVRATLPEERAYLFTANIDRVPSDGVRDAVAFIVEENVPVQLANSVFDFDVIEDKSNSEKLKVVVSVLSKKVVDFYIELLESSGITPVSFDIESQAIARAIVPKGDKRTQMIINLSKNKTGFYVVEDEVVQFTTTLPVGSSTEHLNDLVTEIRKIFGFWSARTLPPNSNRMIEKILLCGTKALNEKFAAELMKESPVEHGLADPWINLKGLTKNKIPDNGLDYASAIGLALYD